MKPLFSRHHFLELSARSLKRFPDTAGFAVVLAAFLLYRCWEESPGLSPRLISVLTYYLSAGCLLTLSLRLWTEEITHRRNALLTQVLAHAILLADAVGLYLQSAGGFSQETVVAHIAIISAVWLSIFILPFFREKDDVASWNFTLLLCRNAIVAWLIGSIMCGGLCLLTASLYGLFGLNININWYPTWAILSCLLLPVLLFIGKIPEGEDKRIRTVYDSRFLQKVIRYLFIPLTGCYLLVLYVYALKILVQWQLPDGWVARLVTALMGGCITVGFLLYPLSVRRRLPKFEQRVTRLLPAAILPLLVLMTVGIIRRIDDYGYTPNRLYLLVLNIWFYAVCAGLCLSRKRIRWIPVSFALLFLLTSVLPWNATSLARHYMLRSVEEALRSSGKTSLPLSKEAYTDWLFSLPMQEALNQNDRVRYLSQQLDDRHINEYVTTDSISFWSVRQSIRKAHPEALQQAKGATPDKEGHIQLYASSSYRSVAQPLDGKFRFIRIYDSEAHDILNHRTADGQLQIVLADSLTAPDTITVALSDLGRWAAAEDFAPQELPCRRSGNRFVLTGYDLYDTPPDSVWEIRLSGYHLIR